MPQRAGERARHAAIAPERFRALHSLLITELPHLDRALVGYPAILAHLASLGIRRVNQQPVTVRMLHRWRRDAGCPILPGGRSPRGALTPPLATTFSLTAWLLSRWRSGDRALFGVVSTPAHLIPSVQHPAGKRPRENSRVCPPSTDEHDAAETAHGELAAAPRD